MQSLIIKTEAIPLRISPFSNTSHIVTWLTPEHGKVATVIKGACRPKSPVFGQYDIGYRCELLFYAREHNELHFIKECSAIDTRRNCRGDWQRTFAISYICHLTTIATHHSVHAPELYRDLALTLDLIAAKNTASQPDPAAISTTLLSFEMQLLKILGIPPALTHCTACRTRIIPDQPNRFSAKLGGMVCHNCTPRAYDNIPISTSTLATLRRWMINTKIVSKPLPHANQKLQIHKALGSFLTQHLDLAPNCRFTAYQMIGIQKKQA